MLVNKVADAPSLVLSAVAHQIENKHHSQASPQVRIGIAPEPFSVISQHFRPPLNLVAFDQLACETGGFLAKRPFVDFTFHTDGPFLVDEIKSFCSTLTMRTVELPSKLHDLTFSAPHEYFKDQAKKR
jgi:hypothetical protein